MPQKIIPFCLLLLTALPPARSFGSTNDYLGIAQRYADAMIAHATDTYGAIHSGLFLSIMERKRLRAFDRMPKCPSGIRQSDRVTPHGSNVNLDQNFYRLLFALTEITRDPRYRAAADRALDHFLKVAQAPKTGLLAWGEHLCWDLQTDTWGTQLDKAIHEPKRSTVLFDTFHRLNPAAMVRYCDGLWEHQLYTEKDGRKVGNFSRHARYDDHDPRPNYDFPKEGGYFIHDWGKAYEKTRENRFLDYIDVLAGRYARKLARTRHRLIEFDGMRNFANTSASLSLAIDSHKAARSAAGTPTADRLLRLSGEIDQGLLALPHDVGGRGFALFVTVEDNYQLYPHKEHGGHSFTWNMKYGRKTTAMVGLLCQARAAQLRDGPVKTRYRQLALQAADLYLSTDPDMNDLPWPVELGNVIFLELAAYELTGAAKYLARARHFAGVAIPAYWPDNSPLPRTDPERDHYENITRADTLALALLKLHAVAAKIETSIGINDIDR